MQNDLLPLCLRAREHAFANTLQTPSLFRHLLPVFLVTLPCHVTAVLFSKCFPFHSVLPVRSQLRELALPHTACWGSHLLCHTGPGRAVHMERSSLLVCLLHLEICLPRSLAASEAQGCLPPVLEPTALLTREEGEVSRRVDFRIK